MSKAKFSIGKEISQRQDGTMSKNETATHKARENTQLVKKKTREQTEQTGRKRLPYVDAVLEAYGIVFEDGYFSSSQPEAVDLSAKWTTAPSDVKRIVICFLT